MLLELKAADITAAKVTDTPRAVSVTGYGPKLPTRYMVQTKGLKVWRRIYVACYGNSGSSYVLQAGEAYFLSPGAEGVLQDVEGGMTLAQAAEHVKEGPSWYVEAEGFTNA